jgi:hypothetical protein
VERHRIGTGNHGGVRTHGSRGSNALIDDELLEIDGPRFDEVDHHGAGDSMFAAIGVGLARGAPVRDALRLAAAAGALNVTSRPWIGDPGGDRAPGTLRRGPIQATAPSVVLAAGSARVRHERGSRDTCGFVTDGQRLRAARPAHEAAALGERLPRADKRRGAPAERRLIRQERQDKKEDRQCRREYGPRAPAAMRGTRQPAAGFY